MPRLVYTSSGEPYYIPDDELTAGNPLYPTTYPSQTGNVGGDVPNLSQPNMLPVAMPDDVSDLPTFSVQQNLPAPKDRRGKEEKLAEMFGVVPGPEGPLGIVQSIESGLTAPGDVVKGNVEQQDVLGRAIDTAGLGITGPLAMKPGTATVASGMSRKMTIKPVDYDPFQLKPDLESFVNDWKDKGVRNYVTESHGDKLKLHDLVVPKDKRGQGIGTEYMDSLIKLADEAGKVLTLSAAKDYGATSVNRLKNFYKRFGFVENKGRNTDFTISDNMYRKPSTLMSDASNVGKVVSAAQHAPTFYSTLEQSFNKLPMKSGTKEQWVNGFKKYGTTNEELEFGLGELPQGQITREHDKILVDKANKIAKKFGGKVEYKELPKYIKQYEIKTVPGSTIDGVKTNIYIVYDDKGRMLADFKFKNQAEQYIEGRKSGEKEQPIRKIPYLEITPKMKEEVLGKGFPLFSASPVMVPIDHDPFRREYDHEGHANWRDQ